MKRVKLAGLLCALMACFSLVFAGCAAQDYTPPAKEQKVSSAALGKNGTLRVGVNAATAPLAGQTTTSARIVGIDVDVAAYLADQMGLRLEVIDVSTNPEAALEEGRVDIVMGIDSSESDGAFWKSTSYITSGVALFAKDDSATVPTTDSNPTIAAQISSKSSWRVTNLFGDNALQSEDDLKSAYGALSAGSVSYVAADAVIGTYVADSNDLDAKVIALLQDPSGYCIGVAQTNTEMQAAVNSAVDTLTNGGIMDIIESKWLGGPLNLDNLEVVKAPTATPESATEEVSEHVVEDTDEDVDTSDESGESGDSDEEEA